VDKIVVIGGGGHAKVVIDVLLAAGRAVAGYTDPAPVAGNLISGVSCLGADDVLPELHAAGLVHAIVALGENSLRLRMAERLAALGFTLVNAIHPSAQISPNAILGRGVAVMPLAVINAGSALGDCAILNTGATVDHDCTLGRGVHIAPGAHLAGYVTVEEEVLVGVGASVGRGRALLLGRRAVVGTGAVVLRDVPPGATVVGNPARPLATRKSPS